MKLSTVSKNFWDIKIKDTKNASIFHTSWWIEMTAKIFKKRHSYYYAENKDDYYLIPVFFENDSQQDYSLGFIGYGGPIAVGAKYDLDEQILQDLIESFKVLFKVSPKKIILNVHKQSQLYKFHNYNCRTYIDQILDIQDDMQEIFEKIISANLRTAIRKAKKEKLYVTSQFDKQDLQKAYHLLHQTQITVGASYTTPYEFLQKLARSEFSSLFLVKKDTKIIAMAVCLFFRKQAFFFLNGWDRSYSFACPNQLLIWKMIKVSKEKECETFNFGVSHSEKLRLSKSKWGTVDFYVTNLERA